jgi:hypothetical protein
VSEPRPPEHEALAALAAQVADLRSQVGQARAWQDRNTGLDGLPARVGELAEALEDALDGGSVQAQAPFWLDLTEEEWLAELADLTEWVRTVLMPSYRDYTEAIIRPCWANHLAAVWELSTIRAEWRRVYDRKKPELAGALNWHDRWLPGVLARLEKAMHSCTAGGCRHARPRGDRNG